MSKIREIIPAKTYIHRVTHNADLLEELTSLCIQNNITLGRIEGLGAVQKAGLSYYNQDKKVYEFFEINQHLEITCLIGNVSLKDGNPLVHVHITLADNRGNAFGGHLARGTIVFACEVSIQAFEGDKLIRVFDNTTGLPLWEMDS